MTPKYTVTVLTNDNTLQWTHGNTLTNQPEQATTFPSHDAALKVAEKWTRQHNIKDAWPSEL